ncbi:acyltransferase family protein [Larkinella rosea]|uniref:Acyltransferase n=1 Tax=Larkinella rosea TaxID=2025312 RepID=A0A3P1BME2_9BACT|nr:acyltransferase [Larkinella rosea]RRB02205.1 acyltransferase [Larkinella rosea]
MGKVNRCDLKGRMTKTKNGLLPRRFYSLDILRGLASLSVVLFHWRHGFYQCTSHTGFVAENQPFFFFLQFFYEQGQKAVELFFTLSGFIFFWLYADRISKHKISLNEFALLRFSRLYPLHFSTLLLVLFLQTVYRSSVGCYFIYPFNDSYHFILQLFFASNWGFEKGFSFNGPIWSVSIEILLYIIFFTISWYKKDKLLFLILLIIASYVIFYFRGYQLAQGVFSFFIGGITYRLFSTFYSKMISDKMAVFLLTATVLVWTLVVLEVHYSFSKPLFSGFLNQLAIAQKYVFLVDRFIPLFISVFLFPVTILALVVWEVRKGSLGKRIAFIGDISYSSYLLHFPLQLATVLLATKLGYTHAVFESPVLLLVFFAVLIALSFLSHRFFEMPIQGKLRRMVLKNRQMA